MGADARVDHHRDPRLLHDDPDLLQGLHTLTRSDRRAEGHDGDGADLLELARQHGVGVDVGKDLEPLGDEHSSGLERLFGIGEEVPRVGDHLELHPVGKAHRAGQAGDPDGLVGGAATGSVGQDAVALPVDHVEDRLLLRVVEVEPAQRHGHKLAARSLERGDHRFVGRILARPDEQSRAQLDAGDDERVRVCQGLHARKLTRAWSGLGPLRASAP